jgi:hypothetical protein
LRGDLHVRQRGAQAAVLRARVAAQQIHPKNAWHVVSATARRPNEAAMTDGDGRLCRRTLTATKPQRRTPTMLCTLADQSDLIGRVLREPSIRLRNGCDICFARRSTRGTVTQRPGCEACLQGPPPIFHRPPPSHPTALAGHACLLAGLHVPQPSRKGWRRRVSIYRVMLIGGADRLQRCRPVGSPSL